MGSGAGVIVIEFAQEVLYSYSQSVRRTYEWLVCNCEQFDRDPASAEHVGGSESLDVLEPVRQKYLYTFHKTKRAGLVVDPEYPESGLELEFNAECCGLKQIEAETG